MSDTRKPEKKYLKGLFIREHAFENGGNILKTTFTREFIDQIIQEMDISGEDSIKCVVARRKEVTDTGVSHYSYIDPWKPKKNYNDIRDTQNNNKEDDEDLPF